jgi:protein SCO1/2
MRKKIGPFAVLFIILVLPLIAYFVLKTGTHRVAPLKILSPKIASPDGSPDSVFKSVGPFAFVSQNGDVITQDSLAGFIFVADVFFSTCPGICPKMSAGMQKIQDAYRNDPTVKLLSISVDPEHDSVPVLRDYADRYEAVDHKWYFLTGNKKEIYQFAHQEFFFRATEDSTQEIQFVHDNTLRLVDKEGRFRGMFYDGTNTTEVDSAIAHIKVLQREYDQDK